MRGNRITDWSRHVGTRDYFPDATASEPSDTAFPLRIRSQAVRVQQVMFATEAEKAVTDRDGGIQAEASMRILKRVHRPIRPIPPSICRGADRCRLSTVSLCPQQGFVSRVYEGTGRRGIPLSGVRPPRLPSGTKVAGHLVPARGKLYQYRRESPNPSRSRSSDPSPRAMFPFLVVFPQSVNRVER